MQVFKIRSNGNKDLYFHAESPDVLIGIPDRDIIHNDNVLPRQKIILAGLLGY